MQANRNINLWQKKAPVYKLTRRRTPKTQQICHYRHETKTSGPFLLYNTGVGFNNNFANLGAFAKVSVPSQFINPYYLITQIKELSSLQTESTTLNKLHQTAYQGCSRACLHVYLFLGSKHMSFLIKSLAKEQINSDVCQQIIANQHMSSKCEPIKTLPANVCHTEEKM